MELQNIKCSYKISLKNQICIIRKGKSDTEKVVTTETGENLASFQQQQTYTEHTYSKLTGRKPIANPQRAHLQQTYRGHTYRNLQRVHLQKPIEGAPTENLWRTHLQQTYRGYTYRGHTYRKTMESTPTANLQRAHLQQTYRGNTYLKKLKKTHLQKTYRGCTYRKPIVCIPIEDLQRTHLWKNYSKYTYSKPIESMDNNTVTHVCQDLILVQEKTHLSQLLDFSVE